MMGCTSGVSTLMKQDKPYIVPVHCVTHKLELGILDAGKEVDYLETFEQTVNLRPCTRYMQRVQKGGVNSPQ